MSESKRRRDQERRQWEASCETVAIDFERDIAPRLVGLSPTTLATATGLSKSYCHQLIAKGKVPHERHWPVLMEALDGSMGEM